jgi:hypothetical protein
VLVWSLVVLGLLTWSLVAALLLFSSPSGGLTLPAILAVVPMALQALAGLALARR